MKILKTLFGKRKQASEWTPIPYDLECLMNPTATVVTTSLPLLYPHVAAGDRVTRMAWIRDVRQSIPRLGVCQSSPRWIDSSIELVQLGDAMSCDWVAIED